MAQQQKAGGSSKAGRNKDKCAAYRMRVGKPCGPGLSCRRQGKDAGHDIHCRKRSA